MHTNIRMQFEWNLVDRHDNKTRLKALQSG